MNEGRGEDGQVSCLLSWPEWLLDSQGVSAAFLVFQNTNSLQSMMSLEHIYCYLKIN